MISLNIKWIVASALVLIGIGYLVQSGLVQEAKRPILKEELILLGPFPFGEFYNKGDRAFAPLTLNDSEPSDTDVTKALNKCSIYILQKKVFENGEWRFEGDPKLLAEGDFRHKLKGQTGKEMSIQILRWVIAADLIDGSVSPMTERISLSVELRAEWANGFSERSTFLGHFTLDANGKMTRIPPKKN